MIERRALMVGLAAAVAVSLIGCSSSVPKAVDHRYVVPKGANNASLVGKAPIIMPAELKVYVGDTITIRNEDEYPTNIGPYFVGANSKITQKFTSKGVLSGQCAFTKGGVYKITVLEH